MRRQIFHRKGSLKLKKIGIPGRHDDADKVAQPAKKLIITLRASVMACGL